MKQGRKILCLLLAVILLIGCLPMGAGAASAPGKEAEQLEEVKSALREMEQERLLGSDTVPLAAGTDAVTTLVNHINRYGIYDSETGTKYYADTVTNSGNRSVITIEYFPSRAVLRFGVAHTISTGAKILVTFDYEIASRAASSNGIIVSCTVGSSRAVMQAPFSIRSYAEDTALAYRKVSGYGNLPDLSVISELCDASVQLSLSAWQLSLRGKIGISLYDFGFVSFFYGTPSPDPTPPDPTVASFQDVYEKDYYAEAVKWAVEKGITSGTDKTHFSPNASCTRAQAVTFLWRAAGEPEPQGTAAGFTDVKAGAYYEKAVQWAVEQGITAGTGVGKFSPEVPCTRGQIVAFLWRKEGSPEAAGAAFGDVQPGAYYETAVKWAVERGITAGTSSTTFSPESRCTRAQIVSFLYRYQG